MRVLLAGLPARAARDLTLAAAAAGAVAIDSPVEDAFEMIGAEAIDAVLLNPRGSSGRGLGVAKAIRAARLDVSMVFLADARSESEEVGWLSLADDVVPLDRSEPVVLARLRAVERRRLGHGANRIDLGGVVLDRDRGQIVVDGRDVPVPPKLYAIMEVLALRAGRFVDVASILETVWANDAKPMPETVHVYVSRLRETLRAAEAPADLIATSRYRGYLVRRPAPAGRIAA